jgi:replicative DNA helicase
LYDRIGGQPYISEVLGNEMVSLHAEYYAEIVQNVALHRRVIEAGYKISRLGMKQSVEGGELMGEMERILLEATAARETSGPISLQSEKISVLAKIEELKTGKRKNVGFTSGFMDLDRILGGFQPGTLNIIAARPSMGKTALALNIAQFGKSADDDGSILFFSLEMSSEQLIHRMLSAQSLECSMGVEVSAMTSGIMSDDTSDALREAMNALQRKIYIYDSSELSALEFRTRSRMFKMRHPDLSLIVVDYLQLMSSGNRRNENRQYEVAEISRVLKSVAVELNCPVIALSQLSRETERRTEKKPQMSDLRDSGAIEQDADTVILLYREDYYGENENNDLMDSKADLRIAKNRNGGTGMCHLLFRRNYTRFVSYGGDM